MTYPSHDLFLDGRVAICQPDKGFRAGLDTVLLAAAVPAREGDEILELGSGAGVASLCLAKRMPGCRVSGIEIDEQLVALAQANARSNALEADVLFAVGDALDLEPGWRREFDHVFVNPPFYPAHGTVSPRPDRARARQDRNRLADWLTASLKRVRPGGTFTAILRADRLAEGLAAAPGKGIIIFPVWPRAGEQANRIILRVVKNSRAPLALLSGLVVHERDGSYTLEAGAILRGGALLALSNRHR